MYIVLLYNSDQCRELKIMLLFSNVFLPIVKVETTPNVKHRTDLHRALSKTPRLIALSRFQLSSSLFPSKKRVRGANYRDDGRKKNSREAARLFSSRGTTVSTPMRWSVKTVEE